MGPSSKSAALQTVHPQSYLNTPELQGVALGIGFLTLALTILSLPIKGPGPWAGLALARSFYH